MVNVMAVLAKNINVAFKIKKEKIEEFFEKTNKMLINRLLQEPISTKEKRIYKYNNKQLIGLKGE